mmetsp:Transcript_25092/g.78108  ORF Transcript_25092/g.78108 Transcript_25092/m.78108 type:complete len:488 (+) Transcript_25092:367-1830(+)
MGYSETPMAEKLMPTMEGARGQRSTSRARRQGFSQAVQSCVAEPLQKALPPGLVVHSLPMRLCSGLPMLALLLLSQVGLPALLPPLGELAGVPHLRLRVGRGTLGSKLLLALPAVPGQVPLAVLAVSLRLRHLLLQPRKLPRALVKLGREGAVELLADILQRDFDLTARPPRLQQDASPAGADVCGVGREHGLYQLPPCLSDARRLLAEAPDLADINVLVKLRRQAVRGQGADIARPHCPSDGRPVLADVHGLEVVLCLLPPLDAPARLPRLLHDLSQHLEVLLAEELVLLRLQELAPGLEEAVLVVFALVEARAEVRELQARVRTPLLHDRIGPVRLERLDVVLVVLVVQAVLLGAIDDPVHLPCDGQARQFRRAGAGQHMVHCGAAPASARGGRRATRILRLRPGNYREVEQRLVEPHVVAEGRAAPTARLRLGAGQRQVRGARRSRRVVPCQRLFEVPDRGPPGHALRDRNAHVPVDLDLDIKT